MVVNIVARIVDTIANFWRKFQVELHGQYSLARLVGVHQYRTDCGWLRAVCSCLLTPVPVVLLLMAIDSIPLGDPNAGTNANYVFWIRNWVSVLLMTIGILEQFRNCLPRLPMPIVPLLTISVFATAIGVGWQILCSHIIGFPLPFGLLVGTTSWTPAVIFGCYTQWNQLLRRDASLFQDMKEYLVAFSGQLSMTVVYPAYIYVFTSLSGAAQNFFVIVLALIKVVLRNWISRYLTNMDDLKPEVLIFNIEVFHALYVSCSLQTSASIVTTLVVMLIDFVQACVSLTDLTIAERKLKRLLRKIPRDAVAVYAFLPISVEILNDPDVVNHPRLQSEKYRSFLANAKRNADPSSKYVDPKAGNQLPAGGIDELVGPTLDLHLRASTNFSTRNLLLAKTGSVIIKPKRTSSSVRSGPALGAVVPFENPTDSIPTLEEPAPVTEGVHSMVAPPVEHPAVAIQHPGINAALAKALTLDERVSFVKYSTNALFLSEFLGLVEFTEVMMPIIYTMYLIGMSQLSNRQFYPRLAALSDDELGQMIGNVMTYAFFEFLSFVMMAAVIFYKLRLSTIHQVAYVLERHATEIQSKLALWTLYIVQCMLFHSGVDFSMRFRWLSGGGQ